MVVRILSLGALLLSLPLAHAASNSDDVCAVRPDLCDDNGTPAKTRSPASVAKARGCRMPGASYSITQADLPICATTPQPSVQQNRRSSQDDDLMDDATPVVATQASARRGPASVQKLVAVNGPKSVSFEDYLAKNALNPALSTKVANHQNAFVDAPVASAMTIPSDGVSNGGATETTGVTTAPNGGMVISTPAGNVVVPNTGGGGGGNSNGGDGFSSIPGS